LYGFLELEPRFFTIKYEYGDERSEAEGIELRAVVEKPGFCGFCTRRR
jgi:hypothetical protein